MYAYVTQMHQIHALVTQIHQMHSLVTDTPDACSCYNHQKHALVTQMHQMHAPCHMNAPNVCFCHMDASNACSCYSHQKHALVTNTPNACSLSHRCTRCMFLVIHVHQMHALSKRIHQMHVPCHIDTLRVTPWLPTFHSITLLHCRQHSKGSLALWLHYDL